MLGAMTARRKARPGPAKKKKGSGRSSGTTRTFPKAFAALLRSRKLPVPKGLESAPPDAYARAPVSFVEELAERSDAELATLADRIATYAERQEDRARAEWESSPLIAELRRRKLDLPPRPKRPAGLSVSLAKPLAEWTDEELLRAAREWSRRARG